jgi:AmmeMemoRadiSam system protein A
MAEPYQRHLLDLARAALASRLSGLPMPDSPLEGPAARPAGAFVTLKEGGRLRGCIGRIEPDAALGRVVMDCAVAAATADPRFDTVSAAELDRLHIEISVLRPRQPVASIDAVVVGRHGLIVESGLRRGLLLPQVAVQWGWDAARFVAETCVKAGLPRDAWPGRAQLWTFEAEVFGE